MMTCRQCTELLMDFLCEELEADHCQAIREHLASCPCCTAYLQTYQITVQLTGRLSCAEIPKEVAERLLAAMRQCHPE